MFEVLRIASIGLAIFLQALSVSPGRPTSEPARSRPRLVLASAFRCPGAPFAFPLSAGNLWWIYRDPMTDGSPDPSGLHSGIDVYPPGQKIGTPVYAMGDGVVMELYSKAMEFWNPGQGVETYYAHVKPKSSLKVGDSVRGTSMIGTVTDAPGGPHVHVSIGLPSYDSPVAFDQTKDFGNRWGATTQRGTTGTKHLDPSPYLGAELNWERRHSHYGKRWPGAALSTKLCSSSWHVSLSGGIWLGSPGATISGHSITFTARAYGAGGAKLDGHVNFTVGWPDLPSNSPWPIACTTSPRTVGTLTNEATCTADLRHLPWVQWRGKSWNPREVAAPRGKLTISFDVYDDTTNLRNLAPNGLHQITY